ncbi:MAG: sigma-70 family RNA polymerase sigma factor [Lachnospiraceae bacterium]|nr:sigma-70 family RNA polymerase sigma factor [Lachnospiraceae bacterium]
MEKQKADAIITEYLHKLHGFAMGKCYSTEEAEDLCAEIVQELYRSLLKTPEIYNLNGYIWRISEHVYAKYVAYKKKHLGVSLDGMEIPFIQEFPSEDGGEEMSILRREIAYLSEKRRKIVFLYYYENKSIREIASLLNLPEGTVKWHLNKSRVEIKEGFYMERNIGQLGLNPVKAVNFSHNGNPDPVMNTATELYLGEKLNLNIVYSVYFSPKNTEEIAAELGITPVFIEDKIKFLEDNGFLVRVDKNHFTTYVKFSPRSCSLELEDRKMQLQQEIAQRLVDEYVPLVRKSLQSMTNVYIPGGNRELLEAAAIFYAIPHKCFLPCEKDCSIYEIKTSFGGSFISMVDLEQTPIDPDYTPQFDPAAYWTCGTMIRKSDKYPCVSSWSIDSRYSSREGAWMNNLNADYDYLYEFIQGALTDPTVNAEKLKRLRERGYITEDNQVNIMVVKNTEPGSLIYDHASFDKIPGLDEEIKKQYADKVLEFAMQEAKNYPPQMQDLVIRDTVMEFMGPTLSVMVLDILYANGTFRPLTEQEKVTANLIMFSDILPR